MASAATAPGTPTNPSAVAVSPNQINIFWSAPSSDGDSPITGYKIEYKIGNTQYGVLIHNTGSTETAYQHAGLNTGQTYHYRISAINAVGSGAASSEVSATPTSSSSASIPSAPIGLTATASSNQITLSWSSPTNNGGSSITGYKIEYKSGSESYTTLIASTGSASTLYIHAGLADESTYSYRVSAVNNVGVGPTSNEASATTAQAASAPGSPAGFVALAASPTQIHLSWGSPQNTGGSPITGYHIEVRRDSISYDVLVENTHSTATTFTHSGLATGSTYHYRVSAINSIGTGPSSEASATAQATTTPILTATAVSPNSVELSWVEPSQTYGQAITGYKIEEQIDTNTSVPIGNTAQTTYQITGLTTDNTYSYVVTANFASGSTSPPSNVATVTPIQTSSQQSPPTAQAPSAPISLAATVVSQTRVDLSWSAPTSDGGTHITGYKIEVKTGTGSYESLVTNTQSQSTSYSHTNLATGTAYVYRVYAINSAGTSSPSNEASATTAGAPPAPTSPPNPPSLAASLISPTQINLNWSEPQNGADASITGYKIEYRVGTGSFLTLNNNLASTSYSHTGLFPNTYAYRVYAINSAGTSPPSNEVSISTVSEQTPPNENPEPPASEPKTEPPSEPEKPPIASFVDPQRDPMHYVNRYNNEPEYKAWFERNYPGQSIYEAVGLTDPNKKQVITTHIPGFPDPDRDPQYYVDRYNNEIAYMEWFDKNFPGQTIYQVLQISEPGTQAEPPQCGTGTHLEDGACVLDNPEEGGGCLIATAAYGTELAPQVQMLREIRDGTLYRTALGTAFMTGFNEFYYSFSPTVANWERQSPLFKDVVKLTITPMLSTLSILSHVDVNSEQAMFGYGAGLILLNAALYVGMPAAVLLVVKNRLRAE